MNIKIKTYILPLMLVLGLLLPSCTTGSSVTHKTVNGYELEKQDGEWCLVLPYEESDDAQEGVADGCLVLPSLTFDSIEDFLDVMINCQFSQEQKELLILRLAPYFPESYRRIVMPDPTALSHSLTFPGEVTSDKITWYSGNKYSRTITTTTEGRELKIRMRVNLSEDAVDERKEQKADYWEEVDSYDRDGVTYRVWEPAKNSNSGSTLLTLDFKANGLDFMVRERYRPQEKEAFRYEVLVEGDGNYEVSFDSTEQLDASFFRSIRETIVNLSIYAESGTTLLD